MMDLSSLDLLSCTANGNGFRVVIVLSFFRAMKISRIWPCI